MYYFYDTNALLSLGDEVLKQEFFYLSSITLQELESIKNNRNKTEEIKFKARQIVHLLMENPHKYEVVLYIPGSVDSSVLEENPDSKICACAANVVSEKKIPITFVTGDLCCAIIAKYIFKLPVILTNENNEIKYTGFVEQSMSEDEMAHFYSNPT